MSNRFLEKTDRLGFGLLMTFVAECTLGSSGRWLVIGGVSIRMLLFVLCFVATLPALCSRLRQTMRRPHVALAILLEWTWPRWRSWAGGMETPWPLSRPT